MDSRRRAGYRENKDNAMERISTAKRYMGVNYEGG
jgi:hypothetical protein